MKFTNKQNSRFGRQSWIFIPNSNCLLYAQQHLVIMPMRDECLPVVLMHQRGLKLIESCVSLLVHTTMIILVKLYVVGHLIASSHWPHFCLGFLPSTVHLYWFKHDSFFGIICPPLLWFAQWPRFPLNHGKSGRIARSWLLMQLDFLF